MPILILPPNRDNYQCYQEGNIRVYANPQQEIQLYDTIRMVNRWQDTLLQLVWNCNVNENTTNLTLMRSYLKRKEELK